MPSAAKVQEGDSVIIGVRLLFPCHRLRMTHVLESDMVPWINRSQYPSESPKNRQSLESVSAVSNPAVIHRHRRTM
ncbi:unannotated protein [freshwater metagenome]|uniref:Unannotated protein n=1 Tax=freshwater metagenome TaxID=449393 RepID=A0A6J7LHS2_9ZZZZ